MNNSTYILDDKLLASNGKRFLNYILDIIFIFLLIMVLTFFFAIFANLFDWIGILFWMGNMSDVEGQVLFLTVLIIYYMFTEGLFGRSLAKFITGTIVVDENGIKPDFVGVLKRSLSRLIPFEAFSFLGSSGRGWHDSLSDTYVVDKKALVEEKKMFNEFNLIGTQEIE
jgi:uncharacterized RDD family membrane protein YckC